MKTATTKTTTNFQTGLSMVFYTFKSLTRDNETTIQLDLKASTGNNNLNNLDRVLYKIGKLKKSGWNLEAVQIFV